MFAPLRQALADIQSAATGPNGRQLADAILLAILHAAEALTKAELPAPIGDIAAKVEEMGGVRAIDWVISEMEKADAANIQATTAGAAPVVPTADPQPVTAGSGPGSMTVQEVPHA